MTPEENKEFWKAMERFSGSALIDNTTSVDIPVVPQPGAPTTSQSSIDPSQPRLNLLRVVSSWPVDTKADRAEALDKDVHPLVVLKQTYLEKSLPMTLFLESSQKRRMAKLPKKAKHRS